MNIGERIKIKRKEKGWSQRDLAAKIGYSNHSTVGKIETGKVDLPQSKVIQFAEVLGVSVAYLMGWEDQQKENPIKNDGISDNRQALIDFAMSVPDDKVEMILRVMSRSLRFSRNCLRPLAARVCSLATYPSQGVSSLPVMPSRNMDTLFMEALTVFVRDNASACSSLPYCAFSFSCGGIWERNTVPQLLHS